MPSDLEHTNVFARLHIPFVRLVQDGSIDHASEAFARLCGQSATELKGRPLASVITFELQAEEALRTLLQTAGDPLDVRGFSDDPNHGRRYLALRAAQATDGRFDVVVRDVTQHRDVERALAESRDRYLALFESVNAAIFIADAETGRLLDANVDAERLIGRTRAELIGMHQSQLHPPVEEGQYRALFRTHVSSDKVASVEAEVERSDGVRVPVSIYGSQSMFEGRLCQIGVFHDLTEQRKAEAEFRKASELHQAIISHAAEGIAVCHATEDARSVEFTVWNDRMTELTGYTHEEINRLGIFDTLWPDSSVREAARTRFRAWIEGGEQVGKVGEVVRKDGERRIMSFSTSTLQSDAGRLQLLAFISDLTDRERMAEQLRQSEKMEAIGHLAGGIAHDINNQLAGIMGLAELMKHQLPADPDKAAERAGQIVDICKRARGVTHQLLAFARRGRYQAVTVDMHDVVGDVVSMLSHSLDKCIRLAVTSNPGEGMVQGDPGQIHTALLNIAINARDAMPNGGELSFAVSRVGEQVEVEITDTGTGTGMSDATRKRIFEPFFTTKGTGKGTGMGLAAVYGTVQSHGGRIEVESKLGVGTTFRVLLPYHRSPSQPVESAPRAAPAGIPKARVLLADDDETIRETLSTMLDHLGHDVTVCVDGREALDTYREKPDEFDLVLLDMVMPQLGGPDVFRAMREINPDVKVLLISGHTVDVEAREVLALGAAGFLQKPFSVSALSRTLEQVFSAGGH